MKTFTLASLALISLIGAATTFANDNAVATTLVKYGDLDLTSADGAAVLYRRLNSAALKVCESLDISQARRSMSPPEAYKTCLRNAISGAVAKIDRPEFSAYVGNRTVPAAPKLASR